MICPIRLLFWWHTMWQKDTTKIFDETCILRFFDETNGMIFDETTSIFDQIAWYLLCLSYYGNSNVCGILINGISLIEIWISSQKFSCSWACTISANPIYVHVSYALLCIMKVGQVLIRYRAVGTKFRSRSSSMRDIELSVSDGEGHHWFCWIHIGV